MMKKTGLFLALILLSTFLCPLRANASSPAGHLTVILIVDNSGSMKTSDPGGLRFTGARLFASLLDSGDSACLVLFATQSEVMTNGIVTLDSQHAGSDLLEDFQPLTANGFTDVKAALEDAGKLLEQAKSASENVVIVLLTDGKPEIPAPYPQYEQEALELARSFRAPVMAIALTSAAQTPFLDQLAAVTNGSVTPAGDASDLLTAYLQILGQIKDRTVLGGENFMANGSMMIEPALAPYITAATFVVSKPESVNVELFHSAGQEIAGDPSSDGRYSIFSLGSPGGGEYSFRLQGGGEAQAWVILRSRLRVQIVSPGAIHPLHRDLPIVVNLLEETSDGDFIKIIGDANFTALVTAPDGDTASLDRFYDDGTHGDETSGDGDYTRILPVPGVDGSYLIAIQGWKGAIPVQAGMRVRVERFPELIADSPTQDVEVRGDPIELQVHLDIAETFDQGGIIARITTPSGVVEEIPMRGSEVYVGEYLPLEDGRHHIAYETRDVKYRGVDYQTGIEGSFAVNIIPFVDVSIIGTEIPVACFSASNEVLLSLSVSSRRDEDLRFSVSEGWKISPEAVRVQNGQQDIQLQLQAIDGLNGETTRVEMLIEGDDRLEVLPEAKIEVDFHIPGLYARCRTPIHLGIVILLMAAVGIVSIQRSHRAVLPPLITGTLRHWRIGANPVTAVEIDLTEFKKNTLLIGCGATCDVMITSANLVPKQARMCAERSADRDDMYLEPLGEVRKGYSRQNIKFALRHGDTFRMGTHEFQYLSDHGE